MGVLEIIAGVLLIISCLVVILMVVTSESKGQGLSSVITGGGEMMNNESRGRSREQRQEKFTRIAAIVLFVLTLAVNVLSVLTK